MALSDAAKARSLLVWVVLLDLALGVGAVRHVVQTGLDSDEVEHAHVTWSIGRDVLPYRDLHQIHGPLVWLVCEPLVARLPHRVETLLVLRGICLLAFAGIGAAALLTLREVLGRVDATRAAIAVLVALAFLPGIEGYRFRPDPFMALGTAWAVWAAVRMRQAPVRYAIFAGLALGLAASFSPKMAPLCLLVPLLCVWESWRRRAWRPLWLVIPHALGFAVGLLPMAVWVLAHGLLDPFIYWTMKINAQHINLLNRDAARTIGGNETTVIVVLAIVGGVVLARRGKETRDSRRVCGDARSAAEAAPPPGETSVPLAPSWPPPAALLVAAALSLLTIVIGPNHVAYNLQAFAMPAAVLVTVFFVKLPEWDRLHQRSGALTVGIGLALVAAWPITVGVTLGVPGNTVSQSELQRLIDLTSAADATCVGFAPWHPIYCRDATELYLISDLMDIVSPGILPAARGRYIQMWADAISTIEKNPPSLIVDHQTWHGARTLHIINRQAYARFREVIDRRYRTTHVGKFLVYVRKPAGAGEHD